MTLSGAACSSGGENASDALEAAADASGSDGPATPRDLADAAGGEGGDASGDAGADGSTTPPRLLDLWNGKAHFVADQKPAPVPGAPGHREAFAVERKDIFHWMFFEGGSVNLNCGTAAEQNDYGWGLARSTTLTSWQDFAYNPVMQGVDAESCGNDMPQPLLRSNGELLVYHPSDDVSTVERARLAHGSACTPAQTTSGYRERNFVCLPTCGGAGGTSCSQTKSCAAPGQTKILAAPGNPGLSADCTSCCQ